MPVSVVSHVNAGSANGNNVTTGAINTTGAGLLVVNIASANAGTIPVPSDSKSNTWVPLTRIFSAGAQQVQGFYCLATPTVGSGHTFTATGTGSFPSIQVAAFDGVGTPTFDQQSAGNFSFGGLGIKPGSIAPAAYALFVTGLMFATARTITIDSGFTITDQNNWFALGNDEGGALGWNVSGSTLDPQWFANSAYANAATWHATFLVPAPAAGFAAHRPGLSIEPQ